MNSGFLLELLNGNWGIAAAALTIICAIYLVHETISRGMPARDWRKRFTLGMQMAVAVMTLSFGVAVRSAEVYVSRVLRGDIDDLSKTWLIFGSVIALIGFLCTIRVVSRPLYGNGPWIWTLIAMALFSTATVAAQFYEVSP